MNKKLRAFLVDDEPLALKRLARLLAESGKIEIAGQTSKPLEALEMIPDLELDALFLDIQMPELTGFELLEILQKYPPVIFTTAFDEFALRAFEVYAVDYLLKPVESERLEKAIEKLKKLSSESANENIEKLLADFSARDSIEVRRPMAKIASRTGGKARILDIAEVTHFIARDKLTFAKNARGTAFPVDFSLNQLEEKLDSRAFLRVHRSTIVNLDFIEEVHGWFAGKILIRLKDAGKTDIVVARERVKNLKYSLGM